MSCYGLCSIACAVCIRCCGCWCGCCSHCLSVLVLSFFVLCELPKLNLHLQSRSFVSVLRCLLLVACCLLLDPCLLACLILACLILAYLILAYLIDPCLLDPCLLDPCLLDPCLLDPAYSLVHGVASPVLNTCFTHHPRTRPFINRAVACFAFH